MRLGALAVVMLLPSLALAQRHHVDPGDAQARDLFDQGSAAYEEGRYEEAISAFEEAYSLSSRPLLLFNIANAQERLGRLSDALDNLRVYQQDAPDDERAVLDRRIAQLEQRVRQQQTDAEQRDAQTHDIAQQAAEAAAARVASHQRPERPGRPVDPLPWVALIGGGTFAVATLVFGIVALAARGSAQHDCLATGGSTFCSAKAADPLSQDQVFSVLTDISGLLAVAGITVGIILLVTHHDPAEQPAATTVGLAPVHGGAELVWSGTL